MYYDKADHKKSMTTVDGSGEAALSEQLITRYIEFIKDRFGIIISRDHRDLIRYVNSASLKNNLTAEALLETLRVAEDSSDVINQLVSSITIGETYFFRDKNQVKVLSEKVLPEIVNRKISHKDKTIRIWSAGCSSGEELFTVIMILNDILSDLENWQYYFLATDINIDVLKKGISGVYGEWSMRSIPEKYLQRYFSKNKNSYVLDEKIRKMVTFDYLNLNSESYPSIMNGTVMHDLILCRNVLIYFDHEHTVKIINRLSKCMAESGYLMLGASDPVAMLKTNLAASQECPSLFTVRGATEIKSAPEARQSPDQPVLTKTAKMPTIEKHASVSPNIPDVSSRLKNDINMHAQESKWELVVKGISKLELIEKINDKMLTLKAMALANTGHAVESVKVCEQCISRDKLNKQAYFIHAMLMSELHKNQIAEESFKKALYIDPDYLVCRYQFGLFLIRMKKIAEGIRALKSVINSAKKFPENELVPNFGKMKYKDLVNSIINEIELHQ